MAETSKTTFTYNWQRQGEGFLKWMLPTLITGVDQRVLDQLSEVTGKWSRVELRIQINGVDVPVERFLSSVEHNMTCYANQEAARLVASIPRLDRLRIVMDEADLTLRDQLAGILAEAGIEVDMEGREQ